MSFEKFSAFFDDKSVEELSDEEFDRRARMYDTIHKFNQTVEQVPDLLKGLVAKEKTALKDFLARNLNFQKEWLPGMMTAQAAFVFLNLIGAFTPEHFSKFIDLNLNDSPEDLCNLTVLISGTASVLLGKSLDKHLTQLGQKIRELMPNLAIKHE